MVLHLFSSLDFGTESNFTSTVLFSKALFYPVKSYYSLILVLYL